MTERDAGTQDGGAWVVWRQDDHGNRAEVARHPSRSEAERRRAELEARGHKQIYWVEQRDQPGGTDLRSPAG